MRVMTMIMMLGVLFLLIRRSGDPNTWTWLVAEVPTNQIRNAPERMEKGPAAANKPVDANSSQTTTPAPGGATDQDSEEKEALQEELQAVADGALSIQPEEMPAYNRLLQWVENQSLAEMQKRARKDAVFNQFYQAPDKYRGQLFALKLNVRRILKYTHNNRTLYEVWGWTNESKSWLYVGVVIDLPKGMPIGPEVYEKATLVGYFFKTQGYKEAGAKPRDIALQAPLFVGRLIWHPVEKPSAQGSDWQWGLILLAVFLIYIIIRWGLLLWKPRRRLQTTSTMPAKPGGVGLEDWLTKAKTNELPEGTEFADSDSKHHESDNMM